LKLVAVVVEAFFRSRIGENDGKRSLLALSSDAGPGRRSSTLESRTEGRRYNERARKRLLFPTLSGARPPRPTSTSNFHFQLRTTSLAIKDTTMLLDSAAQSLAAAAGASVRLASFSLSCAPSDRIVSSLVPARSNQGDPALSRIRSPLPRLPLLS
jgi:hypothetical protein